MAEAGPLGQEWRAFFSWRRAAAPFGRYVFAVPFFGRLEGPYPGRGSRQWIVGSSTVGPATTSAERLLRSVLPLAPTADEVCLIDLDPTVSLGGLAYLRRLSGRIVPLFARWPAEPAILPVRPILERLVAEAPGPHERRAPWGSPIFLLDGGRGGPHRPVSERLLAERFDNRYEYQIDYLPPGLRLAEGGIRHVIWISEAGVATGDVLDYERRLIRAGLTVDHRRARTRS